MAYRGCLSAAVACLIAWVLGIVEATILRFMPFHVLFYYEPAAYGTVAEDFLKYSNEARCMCFNAYLCAN